MEKQNVVTSNASELHSRLFLHVSNRPVRNQNKILISSRDYFTSLKSICHKGLCLQTCDVNIKRRPLDIYIYIKENGELID